jgi:hypothetical protein
MFHARTATLVTLTALVAAGCQTEPPRGYGSGRIDPSITTGAEVNDPRILPTSLNEFADYLSRELAQDLAERPEFAPNGMRSIVLLGDIDNKTQIVSSSEFEYARNKVRANLLQSRFMRSKVMWVENRARMASLANRESVGTANNPAGPEAYDPASSFALNMNMYRVSRGPGSGTTNQYGLFAQLVNFATNEIIFEKYYEVKQVRGG